MPPNVLQTTALWREYCCLYLGILRVWRPLSSQKTPSPMPSKLLTGSSVYSNSRKEVAVLNIVSKRRVGGRGCIKGRGGRGGILFGGVSPTMVLMIFLASGGLGWKSDLHATTPSGQTRKYLRS